MQRISIDPSNRSGDVCRPPPSTPTPSVSVVLQDHRNNKSDPTSTALVSLDHRVGNTSGLWRSRLEA